MTVGKRLNKRGLFSRIPWQKSLHSKKKNKTAQLMFVKLHLSKPQDFLNTVLFFRWTKEMIGHNAQLYF